MSTAPRSATVVLALSFAAVACAGPAPEETVLSAAELASRIEAESAPLILDVRTVDEFEAGHIPGALNIPYDELPTRLAELPIGKSDAVIVYCRTGRRAGVAATTLGEAGYTRVVDLEGHWQTWQSRGLPTEQ